MKLIKNYKKFLLKEDLELNSEVVPNDVESSIIPGVSGGDLTLYRLTSHSVVDLSAPGEFYVKSLEDVSPEFLDDKGNGEHFLITVNCPSDNVDMEKSEAECAKHNCDCIIVVKDDSRCEIVTVEPYKS